MNFEGILLGIAIAVLGIWAYEKYRRALGG